MKRDRSAGFTLIELLVVIAIIGLLSSVVLASLNNARKKGRDAARKQAMKQIETALELYYSNNGSYPTTGATAANNSGTYSTQAGWLSALVTDGDIPTAPRDPVNIDTGPWCWGGNTTRNTIYTYNSDGTHYILCSWMESVTDPATLQYNDVRNPWNLAETLRTNYSFSNYNYVITR